jgi:hypothetical protein
VHEGDVVVNTHHRIAAELVTEASALSLRAWECELYGRDAVAESLREDARRKVKIARVWQRAGDRRERHNG